MGPVGKKDGIPIYPLEPRAKLYGPGMGGGMQARALAYPCKLCTGGHRCDEATSEPKMCDENFYCPVGTIEPILCPRGFYCPRGSTKPFICEAGTYSFGGDLDGSNSTCELCPEGHYCLEGTDPLLCPAGTSDRFLFEYHYNETVKRTTEYNSCRLCDPGTAGDDPSRKTCNLCEPGYVCDQGATTSTPTEPEHNGRRCPRGEYCPEGSASGELCPPGTFNMLYQQSNISACIPCIEDRYQPNPGQPRCLLCPTGAKAPIRGSINCTCVGAHRSLQEGTGSCVCTPRHTSTKIDLLGLETTYVDTNGQSNCTPIEYDVCVWGRVRTADGLCALPEEFCREQCGGDEGEFIEDFGYCNCRDETRRCAQGSQPSDCRVEEATTYVGAPPSVADNTTKTEVLTFVQTSRVRGQLCSQPGCRVAMVMVNDTAMRTVAQPELGMHIMRAGGLLQRRRRSLADESVPAPNVSVSVSVVSPEDDPRWPTSAEKCHNLLKMGGGNNTCEEVLALLRIYLAQNPSFAKKLQTAGVPHPCPHCIACRSYANSGPDTPQSLASWQTAQPTSRPDIDFGFNPPYRDCFLGRKGLGAQLLKYPIQNHCLEIGDGICQPERNTAGCGWDGGDCNGWVDAAVCLQEGDTLLFDMTNGNVAHPVYIKDSLLNTNAQFDYSDFTTLSSDSKGGRLSDRILALTMEEKGTYVFARSNDRTKQTVVTVQAAGDPCEAPLAPKTAGSLTNQKAPKQETVLLKLIEKGFYERASQVVGQMTFPDPFAVSSDSSVTVASERRRLNQGEPQVQNSFALYIDSVTLATIGVLLMLLLFLILNGVLNNLLHTKRRRERTKDARALLIEKNADVRYHDIHIDTVTEQELIDQTQHETHMQVVQVMQEMTGHTKHSKQSFKDIHGEFEEIIENMKKDNDGLRQLLAATLLKNGGTEQIEAALRKQVETDIASRTIHSGRFQATLDKVIKILYNIDHEVRNNAKRATKDILFQLSETDDQGLRSADVSDKLMVILDGITDVTASTKELNKLKESESQRGEVADAMYGAARYTNILNPDSALSRSLQMMAETTKAVDESRDEVTEQLDTFVKAAEETSKMFAEARSEFKVGYAKALEMHNPVETKNAQRAFFEKTLPSMEQMTIALRRLLRTCPQTERMMTELLPQVQDSQERVLHELDLRAMRLHKGIEEDLEAAEDGQRMTAAELRKRTGTMINLEVDDDDLEDFNQLELEMDSEDLALEAEMKIELDDLFDDDEQDGDTSLLDLNFDDDDLDDLDLDDMVRKQLLEQHALQQEAIDKALAEERAKAEENVKTRLNTRRRARRKKNNTNAADEAEEAELLKKFTAEMEELELAQQLEMEELENDFDVKLDEELDDPDLQAALKDLDKDFEVELEGIQEAQFREMAAKLGYDENVLLNEMEEFKMMLESDLMKEEDTLKREFDANLELLEADLQKAIAEGDTAAKEKAELDIEALNAEMEREQLALQTDFDIAMAKNEKETTARLMTKFQEELMKTQEGLEMLEEQKFEIAELRDQVQETVSTLVCFVVLCVRMLCHVLRLGARG